MSTRSASCHSNPGEHPIIGISLATGAALGFSAKAIFVKLAYTYGVDAITLLLFRMAFALPFFVLIAVREERKSATRISAKNMAWIVRFPAGICCDADLFHISGGQW